MNGATNDTGVIKILIAAMGGEGGGVLTKWLTDLGERNGYAARYTYIPGVAQRTGATTYYLELFPEEMTRAGGPILSALMPCPGDLDLVLATEPVEAARALQMGYITGDRTTVISSTHRAYGINEKVALGDGRLELAPLLRAVADNARGFYRFDMRSCAAEAGSVINAVLFGALSGARLLPFSTDAYLEVIAKGRAADANRRGFQLGHDVVGKEPAPLAAKTKTKTKTSTKARNAARMENEFPPEAHDVLALGLARLTMYQDSDYAGTFLERLQRVLKVDDQNGGIKREFALTQETGRWLTRLMAYDDIVRVADLKTRPERFQRIREEARAEPGQIIRVTDYLKPGMEEMVSILPPGLAEKLMGFSERSGFLKNGMKLRLNTSSVFGFLAMRFIARLKSRRPKSYRFANEQAMIERWLDAITDIARRDYDAALELARCARLIKGYGQTHCRGVSNFESILATARGEDATQRLRKLREAAMADDKGRTLQGLLEAPGAGE